MFAFSTFRSQCTLALLAATLLAQGREHKPSGRLINSHAIAFNPSNGKLYAVEQEQRAVDILDTKTNSATTVKVGAGPEALVINATTGNVYVVNSADGTVSELNGATNAVTATLKAGAHPYMPAINSGTNKLYVTNTFSNAIAEIDLNTRTTTFLQIGSADNLITDSHTKRLFLIGYEDPNIRMLNTATNHIDKTPAHEHLWGLTIDESSGLLYATESGTAQLVVLDPASGQHSEISVGAIPCAVAVNPKTKIIYVVNYGDNTVTAIDGKAKTTIPVGSRPQAIAVDSQTNRIYVANTHSNSVTVINGRTNRAIATISAGKNPYAITTGSGEVYVANFGEPAFTTVQVPLP